MGGETAGDVQERPSTGDIILEDFTKSMNRGSEVGLWIGFIVQEDRITWAYPDDLLAVEPRLLMRKNVG